ncbi:MAG: hypothetical protein AW08_02495 [Candidatus Accumulibacter adjunctus]|uniref:Secretion system X translation initiation factor n=1 Tax=Candidatus Accumulibacter adjunctus TaxID=1454001 RepID=A0A011NQ40_9PROT|nr:MAG: hypothetical protein AW08_02495 [Candidatus Accumulibacter adjunctus]
MTRRQLLLSSLLLLAAYLALFGDKTPQGESAGGIVQPMPARDRSHSGTRATAPKENRRLASRSGSGTAPATVEVAALIPRQQLIPAASDEQTSRDLFAALSWTPPPPPEVPPPKLKPVAPPLPFAYLGKKLEGEQWEVYLARGDEVLIVREGMDLAGVYRVKSIQPPTLTLLYLPLKQAQTITIGGSQQ